MTRWNPVPELLWQFLAAGFLSAISRRQGAVVSLVDAVSQPDRFGATRSIPAAGGKIPSLPNNHTNEMIGGCEIRSVSGRPPPGSLHDHPVEHRLVVHGFSRRRREGARRPRRAL